MRIAALGRTAMLLDTVRALHQQGHAIPLIVTCRENAESTLDAADWRSLAAEVGAQYRTTQSLNDPDTIQRLRAAECDLAVSVHWVNRISAEAIAAFPGGILNAHGGDLPRYRGNAPFAWAILDGVPTVGFTIHAMDPDELDAGPIYLKRFVPCTPEIYIGDLYRELHRQVPGMFVETVTGIANGRLGGQTQTGTPLRCYPRQAEDGRIEWHLPAVYLARLVRASAEPFPGAFTDFDGRTLIIWRAFASTWREPSRAVPGQVVAREPSGNVAVATGDGVLVLQEVERVGWQDRGPPAEIIRSSRMRLVTPTVSPFLTDPVA